MAKRGNGDERRRWPRLAAQRPVKMRVDGDAYAGTLNDISAGGASIGAELDPLDDDVAAALAIDDLGDYDAAVVRQWDSGVALVFDLAEDDQYALQEELESFRRENDLDWD